MSDLSSDIPSNMAVCTTVAWEVGMKRLEEDEIKDLGKACDSTAHFKTTKDIFLPEWTDWLRKKGCGMDNIREESWNVQYQNPRIGYLDLSSTMVFDAVGDKLYLHDNTLSYDTYSGQIHSMRIYAETPEECYEMLELLAAEESRLCEDDRFSLDDPDSFFQNPYVRKGREPWERYGEFFISSNGYDMDFVERDGWSNVSVNPSFDRDSGRMVTQEEAERTGINCSGLCHFHGGEEDIVTILQNQVRDAGYLVGGETDVSYNYIYTQPPSEGWPQAEEKTCYRSKRLWNLEREEKKDYTYWLEVDYDTAGHSVHDISARLGSKEECFELIALLFEEEAGASEDMSLAAGVTEWIQENTAETNLLYYTSVGSSPI